MIFKILSEIAYRMFDIILVWLQQQSAYVMITYVYNQSKWLVKTLNPHNKAWTQHIINSVTNACWQGRDLFFYKPVNGTTISDNFLQNLL